jgi:hypothetical protein
VLSSANTSAITGVIHLLWMTTFGFFFAAMKNTTPNTTSRIASLIKTITAGLMGGSMTR